MIKLCREVYYMWWKNKELEMQEWDYCIKSNKTIILDIIMLVSNKNPQGYKEHIIYFIESIFGEGVIIIHWLSNMEIYVSNIEES